MTGSGDDFYIVPWCRVDAVSTSKFWKLGLWGSAGRITTPIGQSPKFRPPGLPVTSVTLVTIITTNTITTTNTTASVVVVVIVNHIATVVVIVIIATVISVNMDVVIVVVIVAFQVLRIGGIREGARIGVGL